MLCRKPAKTSSNRGAQCTTTAKQRSRLCFQEEIRLRGSTPRTSWVRTALVVSGTRFSVLRESGLCPDTYRSRKTSRRSADVRWATIKFAHSGPPCPSARQARSYPSTESSAKASSDGTSNFVASNLRPFDTMYALDESPPAVQPFASANWSSDKQLPKAGPRGGAAERGGSSECSALRMEAFTGGLSAGSSHTAAAKGMAECSVEAEFISKSECHTAADVQISGSRQFRLAIGYLSCIGYRSCS